MPIDFWDYRAINFKVLGAALAVTIGIFLLIGFFNSPGSLRPEPTPAPITVPDLATNSQEAQTAAQAATDAAARAELLSQLATLLADASDRAAASLDDLDNNPYLLTASKTDPAASPFWGDMDAFSRVLTDFTDIPYTPEVYGVDWYLAALEALQNLSNAAASFQGAVDAGDNALAAQGYTQLQAGYEALFPVYEELVQLKNADM